MSKEVIGVVGTIAAGKDTAGDYISERLNIPSFQISSPLKEICVDTGIEPTRENLVALGTKLAHEHGDGYLAQYIIDRMPDRAIITGMRQLGQIAVLESQSRLTLIAVDADPVIRFARAQQVGKLGEAATLGEFVAREKAENSPPNAQRLFEVMDLASHHITNNDTLDTLHSQINTLFTN